MIDRPVNPDRRALALMRYGTGSVALLLIAIAIAMVISAGTFPQPRTLGSPGPARLPVIYATLLIILSAALCLRVFVGPREAGMKTGGSLRALGVAAATGVCILLWAQLHFLVLFIPATIIGTRLLGSGWTGSALTGFALPIAVYGVFSLLLSVPFP